MTVARHGQDERPEDRDDDNDGAEPSLVSVRAALILTMSTIAGAGAGYATYRLDHSPTEAYLAGCAAFGASAAGLNRMIGRK